MVKLDLKNSFLRPDSRHGEVHGEVRENFRPDLQYEVVFLAKKLNTRRELGDVVIQGAPVARPHPEPLCVSNLTSKMNFFGQVYHVKWFSGQKVEYSQRTLT